MCTQEPIFYCLGTPEFESVTQIVLRSLSLLIVISKTNRVFLLVTEVQTSTQSVCEKSRQKLLSKKHERHERRVRRTVALCLFNLIQTYCSDNACRDMQRAARNPCRHRPTPQLLLPPRQSIFTPLCEASLSKKEIYSLSGWGNIWRSLAAPQPGALKPLIKSKTLKR